MPLKDMGQRSMKSRAKPDRDSIAPSEVDDTGPDTHVARMVQAERADGGDDLLDNDKPVE